MPMINCPDCGKEISNSAPTCPGCGRPNATPEAPPKKKRGRKFLVVGGVLLFLLILAGRGGDKETTGSAATPKSASKKAEVAALQVDIAQLLKDYGGNEVGADGKYKGKFIEVTGTIDAVKKDILDKPYVTLGTGADFEIPQLQAYFVKSMVSQLGELQSGEKLTVVCKVKGLMLNVLTEDCTIKEM